MMLSNEKSFLFYNSFSYMDACLQNRGDWRFKDKTFPILKKEYAAYYWGKFDQIRHC